jgi:hypothetical protein
MHGLCHAQPRSPRRPHRHIQFTYTQIDVHKHHNAQVKVSSEGAPCTVSFARPKENTSCELSGDAAGALMCVCVCCVFVPLYMYIFMCAYVSMHVSQGELRTFRSSTQSPKKIANFGGTSRSWPMNRACLQIVHACMRVYVLVFLLNLGWLCREHKDNNARC